MLWRCASGCTAALPSTRPAPFTPGRVHVLVGISVLWMAMGWNYYTSYAVRAEPTCVGARAAAASLRCCCWPACRWGASWGKPSRPRRLVLRT